jgi:glucosamine-phosphate N-acetyltransferase
MYRLLEKNDYEKGIIQLLSQLTETGKITKEQYIKQYDMIKKNPNHKVYVLEDNNKIISCGTLLIEPKFIHNCSNVGHIEDVVVNKFGYRGQGLGKKIINFLTEESKKYNCYKVILDCSNNHITFYNKCNYQVKGNYMAKYF